MQVRIILARCSQSRKSFGIRFEMRRNDYWVGTWAFPIKESSAKRENYDHSEIRGHFDFDASYPGCPHCEAQGMFKCSCGKVACWDGESTVVACPWCNNTITLGGMIESLGSSGDL